MSVYDDIFFDYVNSGATLSARLLLPHLMDALEIDSVLDVGCGQGAWLRVWTELGATQVEGVDGDYVNRDRLLIGKTCFSPRNLSYSFDMRRRFDLVQSLEVAEHIPAESAATFIKSLTRHGNLILFSAAPKGQGGHQHINEQSYDYWRDLFRVEGFVAIDYVRPLVAGMTGIEPWYRYNTFLYAKESALCQLPQDVCAACVPDEYSLADISPILYKMRKQLVRFMPVSAITRAAKVKELLVAARRRRGSR